MLVTMAHIKRLIEDKFQSLLRVFGGVLITGIKNAGKTDIAEQYCKSMIALNIKSNKELSAINHENVLVGDKPRLIDE
jgi:serine kinase of HPr protein (carbohydrate metabolism regulator)